ncbi:hypothetical protein BJ170DRAFT_249211 [Xylariales sp. AK1849]|nr:hypothetical protein BJ170DRAFT_249211 [Xylariales sp. AK1849]
MASSSLSIQRRQPQPGSVGKEWDREELLKCGAIGTPEKRSLNLEGEVHPVFQKWDGCEQDLRRELEQPPLLASHLLEVSGLDWISDFVIDDIFDEQYPGRETCQWPRSYFQQTVPETIVRHHRAAWATPDSKRRWLDQASEELRDETSKSIEWQLDPDIFPEKGWVGYTCRHPRSGLSLRELDGYETIEKWDKVSREQGQTRKLTILLMAEYPRRMRELPKDSEEYLLTSFMTSVTILHELAHVMFWRDFRSLTRGMCEPFYGADLEIELGDSFIAHIFGGWVPVPIKEPVEVRAAPTFESGLAWKQHLSWDYHRLRPRYRALYSIPVN